MGDTSRYWTLVRVDAAGGCRLQEIEDGKGFFLQQFPEMVERGNLSVSEDLFVQRQLIGSNQDSDSLGWRCLRCYVSHQLQRFCLKLARDFGEKYGFTAGELFPLVLDDDLRRDDLRRSREENSHKPLAVFILDKFDPERSALSTWTNRTVKSHKHLVVFLAECGLSLGTDWAILNRSKPKNLELVLGKFRGLTGEEVQKAQNLLANYHAVYRERHLQRRKAGLKGSCPPPTDAELRQIDALSPAEVTRSRLEEIAKALREYQVYLQGKILPSQSLENPQIGSRIEQLPYSEETKDDDREQREFLLRYRREFQDCLAASVALVVQNRVGYLKKKKPRQDKKFLKALYLFHCQALAMEAIAPQVGLKAQYQVTRLLKMKEFRTDVAQAILASLRSRVSQLAFDYADPERLQNLSQKLEAALDDHIAKVMGEAQTQARGRKCQCEQNLVSQIICQYLSQEKF